MENGFTISTDKSKLNVAAIHDYLCNKSYWGKGRTIETVQKSIENSFCFGLYDKDDVLVGFARVITDFTVYAYLLDLFILESHRNCGLGKRLAEYIIKHEVFNGVRWRLDTKDAHGLYRRLGFQESAFPERIMEKRKIANKPIARGPGGTVQS